MGSIKSTWTVVCAATLLTVAAAAAQGTLADRKTIVTFSGPVSIPGATLPAGTYVFKLADSPSNRNIVQVFDKEEAKIITTLLAVPAERAEAEGDPVVSFKETPSDHPPAVRYWYYAGEKAGNEFVYPRAQAMTIARNSGESVSAFDTDSTDLDAWKNGAVTKVTSNAEPQSSTSSASTTSTASTTTASTTSTATTTAEPTTPTTTAPVTTEPPPPPAQPTTPPVTAEPQTTPPPPPATAPVTPEPSQPVGTSGRVEAMPHTASPLPLVGLIGLVALAGVFALGIVRRSVA